MARSIVIGSFLCFAIIVGISALPDPGKFTLNFNSSMEYNGLAKNVYPDTKVTITLECESGSDQNVKVGWLLKETRCWNEYVYLDASEDVFSTYYNNPDFLLSIPGMNFTPGHYKKFTEISEKCDESIHISGGNGNQKSKDAIYNIDHSGDFLVVVHMQGQASGQPWQGVAHVELLGPHGYLSMVDFPMLPFYGVMCGAYILMGLLWLIWCSLHWRDLLRIQFWIAAVIFLGMLEKAMFLAEYSNLNTTGVPTRGLICAAEFFSCVKRTLARMLVIIVSLGYGIVKPRLGPLLSKVMGAGFLFFVASIFESYTRISQTKTDFSGWSQICAIPLAVMDSLICWWVFSALVQTTRHLRLRRNAVKLNLYRHFTNTLIFSVIASLIFMFYTIKVHRLAECLEEWRDLWVDEAYWHLLFSIILCSIMFLWRPSQNNQRYAFMPLLDNAEDADSDYDDDELFYKDKVTQRLIGPPKADKDQKEPKVNPEDDPLKWIEENIPESGDNPLPVLDSEEEIETSKLEISKMQ